MPAGLGLLQVAVLEVEQSFHAALGLSVGLWDFFCLFFFCCLAATSAAKVCMQSCLQSCLRRHFCSDWPSALNGKRRSEAEFSPFAPPCPRIPFDRLSGTTQGVDLALNLWSCTVGGAAGGALSGRAPFPAELICFPTASLWGWEPAEGLRLQCHQRYC